MNGLFCAKILDFIVIGEHAVLTIDNTCHEVAFLIGISHALLIDYSLCRSAHVAPHFIERIFNFGDFIHRNGCSCIAFYAALTLTGSEVAAEPFRQNVG